MDLKEIEGNEYSLNVRRYIENGDKEEVIDVAVVYKEIISLEEERETINRKIKGFLKELKY